MVCFRRPREARLLVGAGRGVVQHGEEGKGNVIPFGSAADVGECRGQCRSAEVAQRKGLPCIMTDTEAFCAALGNGGKP